MKKRKKEILRIGIISPPAQIKHIGLCPVEGFFVGTPFKLFNRYFHSDSIYVGLDDLCDVKSGCSHLPNTASCDDGEEAGGGPFDHRCWEVYSRVAPFYESSGGNMEARSGVLRAMEEGRGPDAEMAAFLAARMTAHHIRTMDSIGVRYELLPRESDILKLRGWESAFERLRASGAIRLAGEGKNRGCWVMRLEGDEEREKVIALLDHTL